MVVQNMHMRRSGWRDQETLPGTVMEMLWLFLGGVIGAAAACAIPYSATIVERLLQGASRRPDQALQRRSDRPD